ncbi:MAG: hypothetical protein KC609_16755, partial [Myxococcales bacterium]|nr:hypothetical protein [Myxococcales bacterium]
MPATPRPIEAPKAPAPVVSRFLVRDITKPVERPCNLFGEIPALGLATLKRSHYFRYRPTEVENLAAYRGGANVLYILSFGPRITPDARVGVLTVGVDLTLQREKPNEPGKETLDVVVRREVPYDQKKHGFIKGYARTIIRAALQEAIARAELLGQSRTLGTATLIARVA